MNQTVKKNIKTTIVIIFSALLSAITINVFVYSGGFFPGGFSGISVLINRSMIQYTGIDIPYGLLYVLMNIFPTILVYKYVGKRFTTFSILQYGLVSLFTLILPVVKLDYDIILITIFGGIFSGISVVLSLMQNASGGGTDFIAIYASNRYRRPIFNYILYGNMVILSVAGLLFGWEKALYSIIYQYVSTQVIESRYQRYKYSTLHMITNHPEEVSQAIFKNTRHGITKLKAEGMYSKSEKTMLYMVVNAFEVDDVVSSAKEADPKIFITISKADKIVGNYYLKPME
ncbi:MAG: YitT family protein [Erysipelotrichaceae bacterium]|nr:YitT family protein [Erysipelotrichaceae bacterium]